MQIKFSIHGSGFFIKQFRKNGHVWRIIKSYSEKELNRIIFDHEQFSKLSFKNNSSSYHDLIADETLVCYCTDRFSVLEIKIDGKRHGRIQFYDLIRKDLLFPIFPVKFSDFKKAGFYIIECDIGNFGSATLKIDKFDIELLRFEMIEIEGKHCVCKIIYNDIALEFKRSNTLNQKNYTLKEDEDN